MRDIKEQARQGMEIIKRHERADLSVSEAMQLSKELKSDNGSGIIDAIYTAFLMGVAVGSRNTNS